MRPAVAVTPPAPSIEFFPDVEQRSEEWHQLRRGIPTASNFADVLAEGDGKTRRNLLYRLAWEILSGKTAELYRNADMDRGIEMEPELREAYAASRFCTLMRMGFVLRKLPSARYTGCSPDALVDDDGVLEIKTHKPEVLGPILERGLPPTEYRAQCQGTLWVTGRQWCDLMVGYSGAPSMIFRFERDERFIQNLSNAVEVFDFDLNKTVEKWRRMR